MTRIRTIYANLLTGLVIGLIVGAACLLLGRIGLIQRSELRSLDLRYRLRPAIKTCPNLGYIDYDDQSIDLFGFWPWPRNRQVALVDTLKFYNASAAGYDVFFTENSNIVFHPEPLLKILEQPSDMFRNLTGSPAGEKGLLQKRLEQSFKDYDREFEQSLADAGNIYLAQFMSFPSEDMARLEFDTYLIESRNRRNEAGEEKKRALAAIEAAAFPDHHPIFATVYKKHIFKSFEVVAPLPRFTAAARGTGFAQIVKDLDSTVRLFPIFIYYDRYIHPALTFRMLSDIMEFSPDDLQVLPGDSIRIKNALMYGDESGNPVGPGAKRQDLVIPVDNNCQALINWAGGFESTYFHIPFKLVAYYYAINKCKEISRQFPATPESFDALYAELISFHEREKLVETRQVPEICLAIALSRCLAGGEIPGIIKKKYGTGIDAGVFADLQVAATVSAAAMPALTAKPDLTFPEFQKNVPDLGDSRYAEEIFRNLQWFIRQGRLTDAEPFYFPRPQPVLVNGVKTLVSPMFLENKIFMIGLSGIGTIDLNPMPFEENCPMVAMHTNFLNMLLTRQFLSFPPDLFKYLAPLLLALLVAMITALLTAKRGIIITLLISAAYLGLCWWQWIARGQWLPLVVPLLAIYLSYLAVAVYKYIQSLADRRKIRGIFATMVSPAVLKLMEENPDKFSLTGERKSATTTFSMVNGFAKVTQSVAPDYLSRILSVYLTPASEIIMDYDGYIDKYEGHIIMADFGVPLDDPDNAWKCAYAAIEQQQDISTFQYYVLINYGVTVHTTMGLNWGYVSAGNMGSDKKMQYTVMGDAVNVAARFMPANIIYNTRVITGGETYDKLKDHVELRYLDRLLLKGKTVPTPIYEVLGWKADAYRNQLGAKPLPSALLTRWQHAPGAKIFGYYYFWKQQAAASGIPLAAEIAQFFERQLDVAMTMNELNNRIFLLDLFAEVKRACVTYEVDSAFTEDNRDYREYLDACDYTLAEPVLEKLKTDVSRMQEYQNMMLLNNKIDMLRKKLDISEGVHPLLAESNERIKRFIADRANPAHLAAGYNLKLAANQQQYRKNVAAFYETLKPRAPAYREMMAVLGSLDEKHRAVRDLYEQAMRLYWQRKWDEALAVFQSALAMIPDDQPCLCLVERVKAYKQEPPPAAWQGEFVQTRK